MTMCTDASRLILALAVFLINDHCVCDVDGSEPRFFGPNGTAYEMNEVIYILDGHPLELYCTGGKHIELKRGTADSLDIISTMWNMATVKVYEKSPDKRGSFYYCYNNADQDDVDDLNLSVVRVVVVPFPAVKSFQCIQKDIEYLNCSWEANEYERSYTLYIEERDQVMFMCRVTNMAFTNCVQKNGYGLTWYRPIKVIVETCNTASCASEAFDVLLLKVIKLNPPIIKLVNRTSHSVFLERQISSSLIDQQCKFTRGCQEDYRIQYWYSGINDKANISFIVRRYVNVTVIELKLPCSDQFFEVKIAAKLTTAVGEEFWSDDAVVSFVTDREPKNSDAIYDPTCTRQRVKITQDIMLFEIDKLKTKIMEEQDEIKEKIRLMKSKGDEIKKMDVDC